jgi:hypothetical protein
MIKFDAAAKSLMIFSTKCRTARGSSEEEEDESSLLAISII